jgi:hypothetical protein
MEVIKRELLSGNVPLSRMPLTRYVPTSALQLQHFHSRVTLGLHLRPIRIGSSREGKGVKYEVYCQRITKKFFLSGVQFTDGYDLLREASHDQM